MDDGLDGAKRTGILHESVNARGVGRIAGEGRGIDAGGPYLLDRPSSFATVLPVMTTFLSPMSFATSSPMPEPPPVMTHMFAISSPISLLWHNYFDYCALAFGRQCAKLRNFERLDCGGHIS